MKLWITTLITITSLSTQVFGKTCEKAPRLKEAAEALAKVIARDIKDLPGGLSGFDSVEVTDVGAGQTCNMMWAPLTLGRAVAQIAQLPTCGVVYYFSDKDSLTSFAKHAMALQTPFSLAQVLSKNGGGSVGKSDTEQFFVPVCAALKK